MLTFRQFLTEGRIQVQIGPNIRVPLKKMGEKEIFGNEQQTQQLIRQALNTLHNVDPKASEFLAARYAYEVIKADDSWRELTLTLKINMVHKKQGDVQFSKEGDIMHDYHVKYHGGMTGYRTYKTPKDAIQEIAPDPELAYRGMAWEEWESIQTKGHIYSSGHYNLGDEQRDYTMFGYTPDTALHYAHGFAPTQYKISLNRPGVVIAVHRKALLTSKDDPKGIPKGELAVKGALPASEIVSAWMMVPADWKPGMVEIRFPWISVKNVRGEYSGETIADASKARMGSGELSVVRGYHIRKMK